MVSMMDKNYDTPNRPKYDSIARDLAARANAEISQMFGMPSLKFEGKAFAGFYADAMVFKLAEASHARALGLSGAKLFDPSDMGCPMKEWVVVPADHQAEWQALAREALDYVAAAPAKAKKPAKAAKSAK